MGLLYFSEGMGFLGLTLPEVFGGITYLLERWLFGASYTHTHVWPVFLACAFSSVPMWSIGRRLNVGLFYDDKPRHTAAGMRLEYFSIFVAIFGLLAVLINLQVK
jgi:hypothetical protein